MENTIKDILEKLKWEIDFKDGTRCKILSNPFEAKHSVTWNKKNHGQMGLLHEVTHAKLCEEKHIQFSAMLFEKGTDERLIRDVSTIVNIAQDWFVDYEIFKLHPEELKEKVLESQGHINILLENCEADVDLLYLTAMTFAMNIKYNGAEYDIAGQIKEAVDALLSADLDDYGVEDLKETVNKLLAVVSDIRVELSNDKWVIL